MFFHIYSINSSSLQQDSLYQENERISLLLLVFYFLTYSLTLAPFMCHDVEHHPVCFIHTLRSNPRQISDALIDILVNNSLDRSNTTILHCHYRLQHSCRHSCRHLQSTTGFSSVTNHSGQIGYHVLNGKSHLLIRASHQPSNATTRPGCRHYTATEGG